MDIANNFVITQWYGVPYKYLVDEKGELIEARIAEMADAGFNVITSEYDTETNKKVLKLCEKYGLYCTVSDARMASALRSGNDTDKIIADIAADYRDFPALYGYHVTDEPNSSLFGQLKKIRDAFKAEDGKHLAYINLFPNYANEQQLGDPTYYEHVSRFAKTAAPDLISYDHYHFCTGEHPAEKKEFENERERLIYEDAFKNAKRDRAGFFRNIEDVRRVGLSENIPYMIIVLVVEHGPYRNLTEAEIRFEVFQSLAYGVRGISYFTYWTPVADADEVWHWKNGMISKTGEKLQHYYDVQKINRELSSVAKELYSNGAKSLRVLHVGKCEDEGIEYFKAFGGIENVKTDGDITLGFFTDGKILVANKDYEKAVDIEFETSRKLFVFDAKSGSRSAAKDGKISILPGGGVLLYTE